MITVYEMSRRTLYRWSLRVGLCKHGCLFFGLLLTFSFWPPSSQAHRLIRYHDEYAHILQIEQQTEQNNYRARIISSPDGVEIREGDHAVIFGVPQRDRLANIERTVGGYVYIRSVQRIGYDIDMRMVLANPWLDIGRRWSNDLRRGRVAEVLRQAQCFRKPPLVGLARLGGRNLISITLTRLQRDVDAAMARSGSLEQTPDLIEAYKRVFGVDPPWQPTPVVELDPVLTVANTGEVALRVTVRPQGRDPLPTFDLAANASRRVTVPSGVALTVDYATTEQPPRRDTFRHEPLASGAAGRVEIMNAPPETNDDIVKKTVSEGVKESEVFTIINALLDPNSITGVYPNIIMRAWNPSRLTKLETQDDYFMALAWCKRLFRDIEKRMDGWDDCPEKMNLSVQNTHILNIRGDLDNIKKTVEYIQIWPESSTDDPAFPEQLEGYKNWSRKFLDYLHGKLDNEEFENALESLYDMARRYYNANYARLKGISTERIRYLPDPLRSERLACFLKLSQPDINIQ